jgi:hypothetical protein
MSARRTPTLLLAAATFTILAGLAAPQVHAQTCTVPGSHATIQEAADDPACAEIVLAAQTYPESIVLRRSVTVAGPGTGGAVVQGLVLVSGSDTVVALQHLGVENSCIPDALRASGGAEVVGDHLEVIRSATLPCPDTADTIFIDGFESGNTGAWSDTTP